MRETILIQGAKEHNLKNVTVEIPRDRLIVVTGVSGSGKSSLAFDTIYAEGQRRLMESMSAWAKRFVQQLKRPQVDFALGLSPVISIDQKTISKNPRSTVGTMTDILDYLRMLYASIGTPRCPVCEEQVEVRSLYQIIEHLLALDEGTEVEVRAPIPKIYGEDYAYLLEHVRTNGYRNVRIDGELHDIGEEIELDEERNYFIEVVIDTFLIQKDVDRQMLASLEHGNKISDGFFSFHLLGDDLRKKKVDAFHKNFGCKQHSVISAEMHHSWFTFNDAAGACPTCGGLGIYMRAHPPLLVPDKSRTLRNGAIVKEALSNDKNSWGGRLLESLSQHFKFSLDVPFAELEKRVVDLLFYGSKEKLKIVVPEGARQGQHHEGKEFSYEGLIPTIERHYYWYRKQGEANNWSEEYFDKVMVEHDCPDCGGARLKRQRRLVTIDGKNLAEIGELHLEELHKFIVGIKAEPKQEEVLATIRREVIGRLDTLIGIGLNYLNLNRRSGTLSGGEAQRIRLSSQIGSGLMGMLYVLDEPSIGLHPKDNVKMVDTLHRLRDIGNTVIVVEHDEDTIRAADHIVEMGPGAGIHGGEVVVCGKLQEVLDHPASPTGNFLSGKRRIVCPKKRRKTNGHSLLIRGARHNNLRNVDVKIPLGVFVCVTGASGSGKSSLVHEILYKKLYSLKYDSRVLAGDHDDLIGHEHIDSVIHIDQSPIGRTSRSNPATYIGFYDNIRKLFASTKAAKARGYKASQFSFNYKGGGRCEECRGEGNITTKLSFMPDVEVTCPSCKGTRYNEETLEIIHNDKNIAQVLDMSIEEGVEFFADQRLIAHKLGVLNDLGLGYLTIGHPSTILSGGEAQRIKLASELGKMKRGKHNLYILDEPTTGLHFADIQKLLDCLQRLLKNGHSVLVIEHNLDVIKTADHVIDLGPEGGHQGGQILAVGPPETIAKTKESHTGRFLRKYLDAMGNKTSA